MYTVRHQFSDENAHSQIRNASICLYECMCVSAVLLLTQYIHYYYYLVFDYAFIWLHCERSWLIFFVYNTVSHVNMCEQYWKCLYFKYINRYSATKQKPKLNSKPKATASTEKFWSEIEIERIQIDKVH